VSSGGCPQTAQRDAGLEGGLGVQVELAFDPDVDLAVESFSRSPQGSDLINERPEAGITLATVFVPEDKLTTFERIVEDYRAQRCGADGRRSLEHKALIGAIPRIRRAAVEVLWTDELRPFQQDVEGCVSGFFGIKLDTVYTHLAQPVGAGVIEAREVLPLSDQQYSDICAPWNS